MNTGTLERASDGAPRLRFTRQLPHPPAKVWRAITEPEHLAKWFPDTIHVERWEVGAPLRFDGFDGEVLAFEPERAWEIRWGTDVIRVEIEPAGDGATTLTLIDSFDEIGKGARDAAGWHVCLDQLEHALAGKEPSWSTSERWQEVHPSYVDEFGPEASTIGPPS